MEEEEELHSLTSQSDLPIELIQTEILPRLPIKSLLRFKCVSKHWQTLISNPKFKSSHLKLNLDSPFRSQTLLINNNNSSFLTFDYSLHDFSNQNLIENGVNFDNLIGDDPDGKSGLSVVNLPEELKMKMGFGDCEERGRIEVSILGSCDGLLCVKFDDEEGLFVWNPAIRESREVEPPPSFRRKETVWGFGFVSIFDDYRIISVSQKVKSCRKKAYVFSLRTGAWKEVDGIDGFSIDALSSYGVLVGERVFWRMINEVGWYSIVGFDLAEERFEIVEVPEWIAGLNDFFVCEMRGKLCVCWRDSKCCVEIAMLNEYGDWSSWSRLFRFDCPFYCCNVFGFTKSGKVVVETIEGSVLLIDLSHDESPTIVEALRLLKTIDIVNYVESFVSPYRS